jgi:hypothetical protein
MITILNVVQVIAKARTESPIIGIIGIIILILFCFVSFAADYFANKQFKSEKEVGLVCQPPPLMTSPTKESGNTPKPSVKNIQMRDEPQNTLISLTADYILKWQIDMHITMKRGVTMLLVDAHCLDMYRRINENGNH